MSKNFEILRRAGMGRGVFGNELFSSPQVGPKPPKSENSRPPSPDTVVRRLQLGLEGASREAAIGLVHRIFFSRGANGPRVVVFSGVGRGVGCTWNCACAARALAAHVSGRVCAVDANLRHPGLHRQFGLSNSHGLVAALSDKSSVVNFAKQVADTNLWILPSGTEHADPSRVCTPAEMDARLGELQSQFDYVVIDSPALNLYADAFALGQMSDGIVLVCESSSTQRAAARRAKQNADVLHVRVLGAVLNKYGQDVPELVARVLK